MVRHSALLCALLAVGTSRALAADRGCARDLVERDRLERDRLERDRVERDGVEPQRVEIDPMVRARWRDLPERIKGALDGRDDIDRCARITLRLRQSTILVEVVLLDGRTTSRSLTRGEDVVPTLEALLLLPVAEALPSITESLAPVAEAARLSKPIDASARAAAPVTSTVTFVATTSPAVAQAAPTSLEFSLATAALVGDGQAGVSLAALTFFQFRGWLLGFRAAADHYQSIVGPSTSAEAIELGLQAGRRFRFEHTALDLVVGPALAGRGLGSQEAVRVQAGSNSSPPIASNDGPWTRLLAGARVTFRTQSLLRTFAGVEGELELTRAATSAEIGPAQPPGWTVGLVLGATVGTP